MASKETSVESDARPAARNLDNVVKDCLESLQHEESIPASVIHKLLSELPYIKAPEDAKYTTQDQYSHIREKGHYPMTHSPRGRALVVTMTGNRQGWQADITSLHEMFICLDIKTTYVFDLTGRELLKELDEFASSLLNKEADCLFVVLMGHGGWMEEGKHKNKEFLCTADGQACYIQDAIKQIFNRPDLKGKPKVFIMQTCRGGTSTPREIVHHSLPTAIESDSSVRTEEAPVSIFRDYILCFATQSGYKSYRQTDKGSWYIQEVCKVFKEDAANSHVGDMLIKVNSWENLKETVGSGDGSLQVSEFVTSLTAPLYFLPGLQTTGTDEPLVATHEPALLSVDISRQDVADTEDSEDNVDIDFSDRQLQIKKKADTASGQPVLKESKWCSARKGISPIMVKVVMLEKVNLDRCATDVFDFISRSRNLTDLLIYSLRDSTDENKDIADGLSRALPLLQKLGKLAICGMYLSAFVTKAIKSQSLQVLVVHNSYCEEYASAFIECLGWLPNLKGISLMDCGLDPCEVTAAVCKLLTSCHSLAAIKITNHRLKNQEDKLLSALRRFEHLRYLELFGSGLKTNLSDLLPESTSSFELMELGQNYISASSDEARKMLDSHPNLRWLRMTKGQVSPAAEKQLADGLRARGGGLMIGNESHPLWNNYSAYYSSIRKDCCMSGT